jgi:hypothetical protein
MRSLLLAAALTASTLASAQILDSRTVSTDGHPMQAIWTPDGQHVLVTVSPDGKTFLLTLYIANELMLLTMK